MQQERALGSTSTAGDLLLSRTAAATAAAQQQATGSF
jgi:hypothetical protein